MSEATTEAKSAAKMVSPRAGLIWRGVEIQPPAVAPITPIARIRRAARIAVKKHAHEFVAAE
jgi:hypothetical protein